MGIVINLRVDENSKAAYVKKNLNRMSISREYRVGERVLGLSYDFLVCDFTEVHSIFMYLWYIYSRLLLQIFKRGGLISNPSKTRRKKRHLIKNPPSFILSLCCK